MSNPLIHIGCDIEEFDDLIERYEYESIKDTSSDPAPTQNNSSGNDNSLSLSSVISSLSSSTSSSSLSSQKKCDSCESDKDNVNDADETHHILDGSP